MVQHEGIKVDEQLLRNACTARDNDKWNNFWACVNRDVLSVIQSIK